MTVGRLSRCEDMAALMWDPRDMGTFGEGASPALMSEAQGSLWSEVSLHRPAGLRTVPCAVLHEQGPSVLCPVPCAWDAVSAIPQHVSSGHFSLFSSFPFLKRPLS